MVVVGVADRRLTVVGEQAGDMVFDPFQGSGKEKGYNRTDFYTSSGGRENGESKNVRLPTWAIGPLGELIASRKVPDYRTEADFWRDAAIHRLHDVSEMLDDDGLKMLVNRQVILTRIASRQAELAELNKIVGDFEIAMRDCVQSGDTGLLAVLLDDANYDLNQLRPVYREKLGKLVDTYNEELRKMKQRETNPL